MVNVEPQYVESEMQFVKADSKVNRRYITPGLEINTGKYEVKTVHIRDARPFRQECTLDTTGFELFEHKTKVTDWTDPEQINTVYAAEIEEFVKKLTGAEKVISYRPYVRRSHTKQGAKVQPPASDVHVDINCDTAAKLARELLPEDEKDMQYSRALHMSCWRTFSEPPQDWPLALASCNSVPEDAGLDNVAIWQSEPPPDLLNLPPVPTEGKHSTAFIFPYSKDYQWNFFSNMTKDELLCLKLNDSDHSRAWRTPHCAFANEVEGAHPRESIDIRACCYFK